MFNIVVAIGYVFFFMSCYYCHIDKWQQCVCCLVVGCVLIVLSKIVELLNDIYAVLYDLRDIFFEISDSDENDTDRDDI